MENLEDNSEYQVPPNEQTNQ